jgi:hypothetical protein
MASDRSLRPRDLILDNYNRLGIVVERTNRPSQSWILEQRDTSVRGLGDCVWWNVMPLDGGLVIVPEPQAHLQREATVEDALQAVEYANEPAVKTLLALFPELRDLALRSRRS